MVTVTLSCRFARRLVKAPPGPPPRRGLKWKEETHRWIRPGIDRGDISGTRLSEMAEDISIEELEHIGDEAWAEDIRETSSYISMEQLTNPKYANGLINEYTSMNVASPLNRKLRDDEMLTEGEKWIVEDLTENMAPIRSARVVYRGMDQLPDGLTEVGAVGNLGAFMSTARDPVLATMFMGSTSGVLLEIDLPVGVEALVIRPDIHEMGYNHPEETIINRGQEFQITEIKSVMITKRSMPAPGIESLQTQQVLLVRGQVKPPSSSLIEKMVFAIIKAPPGPPPRSGLKWKEETNRWIRPDTGEEFEGESASSVDEDAWKVIFPDSEQGKEQAKVANDFNAKAAPSYRNRHEYVVIKDYTLASYQEMNNALRGSKGANTPSVRQQIGDLEALMQPMRESQRLFRGVNYNFTHWFEEGVEVKLPGFLSASRKSSTAVAFAYKTNSTFIEIHTTPKTQAITLANEDAVRKEDETILNRGTRFRVERIEKLNLPDKVTSIGTYIVLSVVDED